MSVWAEASLDSPSARTPSLERSDGSALPDTPSEMSPYLSAKVYSIKPTDAMAPPSQINIRQTALHARLPDILDPNTAANVRIRHICAIGAGYVGGPTAAIIALHNPNVKVTVIDRDERRIKSWKGRHLPIHEPGLERIVRLARDGTSDSLGTMSEQHRDFPTEQAQAGSDRNPSSRPNLFFSTACAETIANSDMILLAVNTPTKMHGVGAGRATDMAAIEGAVRDIALHAKPGTILVEKSTVPCKTGQLIKDILGVYQPGVMFPILSNPEFLSEGTAVRDLLQPDRVIIGCESTLSGHRAAAALANLYAGWIPRSNILPSNIWSADLCKLAANAVLAQRISSINSISAICERTGADVSEVARSIGMDSRIGPQFLKAGLGFGGSCFPKDIASLTYLAESLGLPEVASYWQGVLIMNDFQRDRFARNVISCLNNTLRGKKITILGYAFKKNTGDARESPALGVLRILIQEQPRTIVIFDPLCNESDIKRELAVLDDCRGVVQTNGLIEIVTDPYLACADSNAILVLTDWDMFKNTKPATPDNFEATELPQLDGATPANFLRLPHRVERVTKLPSPPQTPKMIGIAPDLAEHLMSEPECPPYCEECGSSGFGKDSREIGTSLDWHRVSRSVKEPGWVFDGRGILEVRVMLGLGFRLETLGRQSMW
ncbi:hypothetical protein LTR37_015257 [Vermiconidia calcicola]|uniref:Uncharacterized protein n=1 Tax=Vermiconidia calcicola TaxID=1690605 RepID=A0ACC3MRB9_9PEZI|nr:hypothetical protein LTR37_015257 [Vermiconidia calcicola]